MSRVFLALPIPDDIGRSLRALAPPHGDGVRAVAQELLHVTVHFLGEAAAEPVVDALSGLRAAPFPLRLAGGGRFATRDEHVALWVGAEPSADLIALHAAAGAALAGASWRPEERPYTPHVTLARCKPRVPAEVIDAFLARAARFEAVFEVRELVLFVSEPGPSGPLYAARHRFPLRSA